MQKESVEQNTLLFKAILALRDQEECRAFFQDLCTVAELKALAQRMEVAQLLDQGFIYNDILQRTGASSATISRVNRSLNYGVDGYEVIFRRLDQADGKDGGV